MNYDLYQVECIYDDDVELYEDFYEHAIEYFDTLVDSDKRFNDICKINLYLIKSDETLKLVKSYKKGKVWEISA